MGGVGNALLEDPDQPSESDLPAFLDPPEGAPPYYGFPLVPETMTDGWCLGVITEYEEEGPEGCTEGDAFVVAPDGSRAGLVWDVGEEIEGEECEEICEPDEERWGVYQVWFPRPVCKPEDLVLFFRAILPRLKLIYERVQSQRGCGTIHCAKEE